MVATYKSQPGTKARASAAPGRRRLDLPWLILMTAVVVLAVAALLWWSPALVGLWPQSSIRDQATELANSASSVAASLLWIGLALLAVAAVTMTGLGVLRRQRERVAESVHAATRTRTPLTEFSRTVRLRRTPWGRPKALIVQLPPDFASEDPAERAKVETAAARVLGGQWRGDWNERALRRGKVRLRPTTPGADTDSDNPTMTDPDRVLTVARRIFGSQARLGTSQSDQDERLEQFTLIYPPHPRLSSPSTREAVANAMTQLLPGVWEVHWDLESDTLRADRRPRLARVVEYRPQPITDTNRWRLQVAQAAGLADPASWNLDGKTPHALVTGETGGGKTYAFLNLAVEALRRGIPVIGVDPKMVELMAMEEWPGFERLATDPAEMAEVIAYLHDLMMYRYHLIRTRQLRRADLWPIVAFLDELLILQEVLNDHWAREKAEKGIKGGSQHPAIRLIVRMAALARTARVHLAVGVQRPQATLFPEGARDNFRFRLSLGSLSAEGAQQMWDDAHIGTEVPADIPGRGTISTPVGPREAQVYKLPELDLTVPDEQLSEADAELRRQLLDECRAALALRPDRPVLDIGAVTLTKAPSTTPASPTEDAAAIEPETVLMPVSGLGVGDRIQAPDPDDADAWVEARIEEVGDPDDEGRILVDYRTADGRPGQWDLDDNEQVELTSGARAGE